MSKICTDWATKVEPIGKDYSHISLYTNMYVILIVNVKTLLVSNIQVPI